jgi:hypothetical protein
MARGCRKGPGRASPLCPGTPDIELCGWGKAVIDLDAEMFARSSMLKITSSSAKRGQ